MKPIVLAVCAVLVGCGGDAAREQQQPPSPPKPKQPARSATPPWPQTARCEQGAANCASARGTVVYVERVDPDGDGDAHLVLASVKSISGPGITAVDIKRSLRPHPLPRIGDRVSAAGPVYRGSYGQRQIQATELNVSRVR